MANTTTNSGFLYNIGRIIAIPFLLIYYFFPTIVYILLFTVPFCTTGSLPESLDPTKQLRLDLGCLSCTTPPASDRDGLFLIGYAIDYVAIWIFVYLHEGMPGSLFSVMFQTAFIPVAMAALFGNGSGVDVFSASGSDLLKWSLSTLFLYLAIHIPVFMVSWHNKVPMQDIFIFWPICVMLILVHRVIVRILGGIGICLQEFAVACGATVEGDTGEGGTYTGTGTGTTTAERRHERPNVKYQDRASDSYELLPPYSPPSQASTSSSLVED